MKDLLRRAQQEIHDLRRQNEILAAKVSTMDLFALVLRTEPKHQLQGAAPDVAWELGNEIHRLDIAAAQKTGE